MKTLFLIAVVSSIGYLVYQESPRIEQMLSASWFPSDNAQITVESVKHEMQKKLDDVTSEREALYELLAKKEALLMARTKQNTQSESTEPLASPDASKRREALLELAQRMELQALGLGVDELAVQ
mgnify:CR=1 FL=1